MKGINYFDSINSINTMGQALESGGLASSTGLRQGI